MRIAASKLLSDGRRKLDAMTRVCGIAVMHGMRVLFLPKCVQKRSKYKVKSLEKRSTPPTAQTPEPNSLIFWRDSIHAITLGMSEAIFEFPIWDRDMGPTPSPQMSPSGPKNGQKWSHISAPDWKFKNRLGHS